MVIIDHIEWHNRAEAEVTPQIHIPHESNERLICVYTDWDLRKELFDTFDHVTQLNLLILMLLSYTWKAV